MKINLDSPCVQEVDVDIAEIAANTTLTGSVPVNGAEGGMVFLVAIADTDLAAGILLQGTSVCVTNGIVPVRLINTTAAPVDPGVTTIRFIAL